MNATIRTTLAACALAALASGIAGAAATPAKLTVTMNALNGSGESGTATLTDTAEGVKVVVSIANGSGAQPTHIHAGTCAKINKAPEWPLQSTVDGRGTSVVAGVTIAQLLKGHFAINVHKSATDLATYVSCGDIAAK